MGYGNLRNDQRNALLAAYCYWTHSLILKFNSAYLVPQGPGTWLMAVLNRGYLNRPRLTCIQALQAHQQPVVWQKLKTGATLPTSLHDHPVTTDNCVVSCQKTVLFAVWTGRWIGKHQAFHEPLSDMHSLDLSRVYPEELYPWTVCIICPRLSPACALVLNPRMCE